MSTSTPATPHPGYMDAAEVTRIHRVTIAYVYKLANRDHWRRYTLDRRVRYHRGDVDKTFNGPLPGADDAEVRSRT